MHNDHGLNVESRHLKDVDDEHWDPSVFMDIRLGCVGRGGAYVCMCCVCTCMFVRENNSDGAEIHQHPILYLLSKTTLLFRIGEGTGKIACLH